MKKTILAVGLAVLALLFQTCREDENATTGNVQFTFNASDLDHGGGRKLSDLPEGSALVVSIINTHGDPVHTMKTLVLLKFENTFISEPLALPLGNYNITDFLITDSERNVLYAAPKEDSPLASLVDDPLPMAFQVAPNELSDLSVKVIPINEHQPEEFGYVSFALDILPVTQFRLAAFAPGDDGHLDLAGVQVYVIHDTDTIYNQRVAPTVNPISFEGGPDDLYTIVVIKDSFKKYSRSVSLTDLNEELDGRPLSIILEPALTIVAHPNLYSDSSFSFSIQSEIPGTGKVTIDWGDGTIEEVTICCKHTHRYHSEGARFISVTGDLDSIVEFNITYDIIDDISLRYLKELKSVVIVESSTPESIDISYNLKLEEVSFEITPVTSLDISKNIYLKRVGVATVDFSIESINQLIYDLHHHVSVYGLRGGSLIMLDVNSGDGMGPLSPESTSHLNDLYNNYEWTIYPWAQ